MKKKKNENKTFFGLTSTCYFSLQYKDSYPHFSTFELQLVLLFNMIMLLAGFLNITTLNTFLGYLKVNLESNYGFG